MKSSGNTQKRSLDEAGELDVLQRRHRRWFADQAERHDPDRGEPVVLEPSAWFDIEQDNLQGRVVVGHERRAERRTATRDEHMALLDVARSDRGRADLAHGGT